METDASKDFMKDKPRPLGEDEMMTALFSPIPYKKTEPKMKMRHSIIIGFPLLQFRATFQNTAIFPDEGECRQQSA